jgi:hypothetical protein
MLTMRRRPTSQNYFFCWRVIHHMTLASWWLNFASPPALQKTVRFQQSCPEIFIDGWSPHDKFTARVFVNIFG